MEEADHELHNVVQSPRHADAWKIVVAAANSDIARFRSAFWQAHVTQMPSYGIWQGFRENLESK